MFFALKGPNFDGNQFAKEAIEKGALFVVIDEEKYVLNTKYILVKNVLKTLQDLAQFHRQNLNIPLLAITGTNGKTTTKELIHVVLSKKYKTYATKGNLNNHIGVPLTLLSISPPTSPPLTPSQLESEKREIGETERGKTKRFTDSPIHPFTDSGGFRGAVIIEMGANHIGEIARLCEIAMPDFGLITNIGKAHLEGFGSFEGVAKAKSELYYYLLQHDGKVFVNSKNEHLNRMAARFSNPIRYGSKGDFYHCELVENRTLPAGGARSIAPVLLNLVTQNGDIVKTNLAGAYNLENIEAALCIGKYFKVNEKDANKAIAEYTPQSNRSEIIKRGTNTIISDAYNANPQSMEVSIKDFAELKLRQVETPRNSGQAPDTTRNKVLILGDMFELGDHSMEEHKALGDFIAALIQKGACFQILLCGKAMKYTKSQLTGGEVAIYFEDKEALTGWLKKNKFRDAYILIKGSRSMELETVVAYI